MEVLTNDNMGTRIWFSGFYYCSEKGKTVERLVRAVWLVDTLSAEKIQRPNTRPNAKYYSAFNISQCEKVAFPLQMIGAFGFSNCQLQLKGFIG